MTTPPLAQATFRYVEFLDLLIDAIYQHRIATQSNDSFTMSRHARASVAAAFLTIECLSNCLLEIIDIPDSLRNDLDKLPPLAKIEVALRSHGKLAYDRGRNQVQMATEVLRVRNAYVHSKATKAKAEIHVPQDSGSQYIVPFAIYPELWNTLKIPKQSMFWSADVSRAILQVVRDFIHYVLVDVLQADDDLLTKMLTSQVTMKNPGGDGLTMSAVADEFKTEMVWMKEQKIDFSFLQIFHP